MIEHYAVRVLFVVFVLYTSEIKTYCFLLLRIRYIYFNNNKHILYEVSE